MPQDYLDPFLIEKIRDGDNKAFKVVMDQLHTPLASMAKRLLFNVQDVEDVIAEAFLKLFIQRVKMESISNVEGFLHITVKNLCIDLLRAKQRQQGAQNLLPVRTQRPEQAGRETEADHNLLLAELSYWVHLTLQGMPEHFRIAYQLRVLEKTPMAEVCLQLGVTEKTAREYVNRARKEVCGALISKGLFICLIIWVLKTFL